MAIDRGATTSYIQDCLLYSQAFWVSKSIIAWNVDVGGGSCYLCGSKNAVLSVVNNQIQGDEVKIKLEASTNRLPEHVIENFSHIEDYKVFRVPPALDVKSLLKCQLAVAVVSSDGKCTSVTGLQLPGILDELFSYKGPLGAIFSNEAVTLYLWAPTAQAVRAFIHGDPIGGQPLEVVQLEEFNGVWSAKGPRTWEGCYYVYEVSVYHPSTLLVEKCIANDPYARGCVNCLVTQKVAIIEDIILNQKKNKK